MQEKVSYLPLLNEDVTLFLTIFTCDRSNNLRMSNPTWCKNSAKHRKINREPKNKMAFKLNDSYNLDSIQELQ